MSPKAVKQLNISCYEQQVALFVIRLITFCAFIVKKLVFLCFRNSFFFFFFFFAVRC